MKLSSAILPSLLAAALLPAFLPAEEAAPGGAEARKKLLRAIDARAPNYDGGIVTRLDCVTLGIMVNKYGDRYYDEGEDFWGYRYAIWGISATIGFRMVNILSICSLFMISGGLRVIRLPETLRKRPSCRARS